MNLDRLLDVWEKLGERERQVLVTLGQRLYVGQKRHGKLSIDKKDWTYEAIEEALDGSIYLTCALADRVDKAFNNAVADAEAEVTGRVTGQLADDSTINTAAEPY